jgi:hypothetical protein
VKEARFGGKCTEKDANQMTPRKLNKIGRYKCLWIMLFFKCQNFFNYSRYSTQPTVYRSMADPDLVGPRPFVVGFVSGRLGQYPDPKLKNRHNITYLRTRTVERSASQNDVNDEINLPGNECSNSGVVFLYIEGLYISKQYSSRSASSAKLSISS